MVLLFSRQRNNKITAINATFVLFSETVVPWCDMIAFVRDKLLSSKSVQQSVGDRLTSSVSNARVAALWDWQWYSTSSSSSSRRRHALPIGSLTALRVKCGINFRFIIIDLLRRLDAGNYVKFTAVRVRRFTTDDLRQSVGRLPSRKTKKACRYYCRSNRLNITSTFWQYAIKWHTL